MLTELRPKRSEACLSDHTFDAWRAGELGEVELISAKAHLASCQRCDERQRGLDAAAAAFLEQFPMLAPSSKPTSGSRTTSVQRATLRPLLAWVGTGLAAAAALLLVVHTGSVAPDDGKGATRIKGADRIGFFVRRGEQVFEGEDGQRVRPRDQLRFSASTLGPRHLAILSRDDAGVASIYYPTTGALSHALGPKHEGPLESAMELDDTLGREELFGVFCDAPFELEPLRAELEGHRKLAPLPGCKIDRLELVKERAE